MTRRALSLIAHGQGDKRLSESEPDSESSESNESESDNDVFNSENDDDDTSVEEEDDSAEQQKNRESDLLHVKGLQWTRVDSVNFDYAVGEECLGRCGYANLAGENLKSLSYLDCFLSTMYPRGDWRRVSINLRNTNLVKNGLMCQLVDKVHH